MVDWYHRGEINRLNPEDHSVPLVRITSSISFPGGAENVAANVRALCPDQDVDVVFGIKYSLKHRIIVGGRVICRFDNDFESNPILPNSLPTEEYDAVIISDYGKGSIDRRNNLAKHISKVYQQATIFVDTKENPSNWSGCANFMFPNELEYASYAREYDQLGCRAVLKMGHRGAALREPENKNRKISVSAKTNNPVNVSGAGDTVIAAFAIAHTAMRKYAGPTEKNITLTDCLEFAMMAAAIAVEEPYTHAPTSEQMLKRFTHEMTKFVEVIPGY
jgi:bifunctional ADP-heptose synthase (sugar kinase/adenylyltransferase)